MSQWDGSFRGIFAGPLRLWAPRLVVWAVVHVVEGFKWLRGDD